MFLTKRLFQSLYDATSETSDVNIYSWLKDILTELSRIVTYDETLIYVVDGNDTVFAGIIVNSSPKWSNVLPPVLDKLESAQLRE